MRTLIGLAVGTLITVALFWTLLAVGGLSAGYLELAIAAVASLGAGVATVVVAVRSESHYQPLHSSRG